MFAFLKKLFSPSVDSIIADITQKVEQLHAVAELHNAEIVAKQAIINEAAAEYDRAKAIAGKLTALVS